ncbi:MAG: MoaD/ThiS family protein [Gammaproteobacteria bacterium]|nr:MoaD/ThiS family protein [Gammaproteobacteria bacterium]
MQLKLKLYATLAEFLPPTAVSNVADIEVADDATPFQIIDRYHVPRTRAHLVLHNGNYVPPTERDNPIFRDGDSLAIWPPVAGG